MDALQKEWLDLTNDYLDKFKELVKDNKTLSLGDALLLSKQINSNLNDERFSSAWTAESQEKWQEIKSLFGKVVDPLYFVSGSPSSAIN